MTMTVTTDVTLSIECDAKELLRFVKALRADLAKGALQISKRFVELLDFPAEIPLVEIDLSSTTANKIIICLKPSDRFRMVCAAFRAGDCDRLIVEKSRHGALPSR
jgi:hypothetical protein